MEIKPTGAGGPSFDPAAKTERAGKKPYADLISEAGTPESVSAAGLSEFSKADLQDPAKLDVIVNRYLGEFLDSASERMGVPVSSQGKSEVAEYLASDPMFRGKLINYLEQVLE